MYVSLIIMLNLKIHIDIKMRDKGMQIRGGLNYLYEASCFGILGSDCTYLLCSEVSICHIALVLDIIFLV